MPTRNATATWTGGGLKSGKGEFSGESGVIKGKYNFNTRFGDEAGTNPEELLAAAEAACFSMALSLGLEQNGTPPQRIETKAACTIAQQGGGFKITTIKLDVTASVPNVDAAKFKEIAENTKKNCPVSVALAGVDIQLNAKLA
ncbi:MAG: OsmC family peroxiredoxin [Gemmatimonadaceae bacterium]|nr:OsmC family peroxiredoxin [Gemmatimonadaceae bacterium]NUQ94638.1 OsmC family peroxiredoxin [Gemmatimonadaceae bacterium]NUR20741.1 OsmC family peroxiredoxin [Gemmatimonadaceae bacterium]NUS96308.1 OsmC family peroxiredoxin [Gemmatimonadaceae bacterium]